MSWDTLQALSVKLLGAQHDERYWQIFQHYHLIILLERWRGKIGGEWIYCCACMSTDLRQSITNLPFLELMFWGQRLKDIPETESEMKVVPLCFPSWSQGDSIVHHALFIYLHTSYRKHICIRICIYILQNCSSFVPVIAGLRSLLDL